MKKAINDLKRAATKGFWILFLIFGLQSFTFSKPYFVVLGIMLIMLSFLTNPFFNKITNKIKINLSRMQKWFIGITIFLTAAYSITEEEKNYYRVAISVGIMLLFWIITIIYSNKTKIKRITTISDEKYLRQKSLDVDFNQENVKKMIKKIKAYCRDNDVYSLAPIQIGVLKRVIYIKKNNKNILDGFNQTYDDEKIYINPVIIESKGKTKFLETCESCIKDKKTYCACVVERPYSIKVKYYDVKGNEKEEEITGFDATIFNHEYDHLDGILHVDKATKKYEMTLKEIKAYRIKHPYKVINKTSLYKNKK